MGLQLRDAQPVLAGQSVLNALTIDVEDYFHVSGFADTVRPEQWTGMASRIEANTHRVLDILADADVRATFFVLGWVAEHFPRLVQAIQEAGHEIGCHSYAHRLIYNQTPDEFRADLRRARVVIEDATGQPVAAYRAPSFSLTLQSLWALEILVEEGFRYDSSIYPTHHDRYGLTESPLEPYRLGLAAGELWEYPMPVWRCFGYPLPVGGGGYFRLYPYALTRFCLNAINRDGRPFAAYVHPWEVDPDQPRVQASRLAGFRHYVNLRRTETRLARLLRDFAFGPLSDSLARYLGEGSGGPVKGIAA
jgi:polysaccharide deacetylase family protein (PEP-CTERM system associated)